MIWEMNRTEPAIDVACFIEQAAYSGKFAFIEVLIHSANPVGRARMEQAISRAEEFWSSNNDRQNLVRRDRYRC
jgi:hypothetical protein